MTAGGGSPPSDSVAGGASASEATKGTASVLRLRRELGSTTGTGALISSSDSPSSERRSVSSKRIGRKEPSRAGGAAAVSESDSEPPIVSNVAAAAMEAVPNGGTDGSTEGVAGSVSWVRSA